MERKEKKTLSIYEVTFWELFDYTLCFVFIMSIRFSTHIYIFQIHFLFSEPPCIFDYLYFIFLFCFFNIHYSFWMALLGYDTLEEYMEIKLISFETHRTQFIWNSKLTCYFKSKTNIKWNNKTRRQTTSYNRTSVFCLTITEITLG